MRRTTRTTFVAALVAALSMLMVNFAYADTLQSDLNVDLPTDQNSTNLGSISGGSAQSVPVKLYVTSTGNNATTFPVSVTGSGNSFGATMSSVSITGYGLANAATGSIGFTAPASQATAQNYSVTVDFSSPADNLSESPAKVTIAFSVPGTVVSPPSDTAAPTNASIDINSGANWTSNRNVSLALGANDNVGVVRYRLAETQAGLTGASDVAVTSATAFNAPNVPLELSTGDGTKTVWLRVFDAAGNSADTSDTIGLDTVAPTITGGTGTYSRGAWTNQTVNVSFSCGDNLGGSGIGTGGNTLTSPVEVAGSGADQSVTSTGACTDLAGNSATHVTVDNIDIDKVLPVVNVTDGTNNLTSPASFSLGSVPTFGCSTTDALSDVKTNATLGTYNTGIGASHSVTCSGAEDNAGNTNSATLDYSVTYGRDASSVIGQPINPDNSSLFNQKRAVPVKFGLAGDGAGTAYANGFSTAGWTLTRVAGECGGFDDGATGVETAPLTASTGFRYDATADQYVFNATLTGTTVGGCYKYRVNLNDGTTIMSPLFKVTK